MQSDSPDGELNSESPAVIQRRARRCRITAVIVLLLGIASAGLVYWLESRALDYSDDPAMLGFNRATERQMGLLYGKQGQLIEDLNNSLKQPGTQAILILVVAGIIAAVCFRFARNLEDEAEETAEIWSGQKLPGASIQPMEKHQPPKATP
jgi:peptidoglycan/LPS O-acetylase OafA/YrhL